MSQESTNFSATGKRKSAIARVTLRPGDGKFFINSTRRELENYFPSEGHRIRVHIPFKVTECEGQFDVYARLDGGGVAGQADALCHGIARALLGVSPDYRALLKAKGMLTRDSRIKERKKYGQPGARKKFQYSKR